ncbi:MAG: hypothetical protein ACYCSN_17505 [Acidobacteriaceae bacterium]
MTAADKLEQRIAKLEAEAAKRPRDAVGSDPTIFLELIARDPSLEDWLKAESQKPGVDSQHIINGMLARDPTLEDFLLERAKAARLAEGGAAK